MLFFIVHCNVLIWIYMIYVYHISCHELFSMNFLGCYYLKGTISKDDLLQPLCSCGSLGRVRAGWVHMRGLPPGDQCEQTSLSWYRLAVLRRMVPSSHFFYNWRHENYWKLDETEFSTEWNTYNLIFHNMRNSKLLFYATMDFLPLKKVDPPSPSGTFTPPPTRLFNSPVTLKPTISMPSLGRRWLIALWQGKIGRF